MEKKEQKSPTPNICSSGVIVDYRTNSDTVKELKRLGFTVYFTKHIDTLYKEVAGHSDMQIHFVNNKGICEPTVYEYYSSLFRNVEIKCGTARLTNKYPNDIAYNVCNIGNFVVCKEKYTATEILSEYQTLNKKILNANQGYAKCSICTVNDESAITADNGMYQLLKKNDVNVLKITEGYIKLYDMNGFIGGASGLLSDSLIAFNGDIKKHPDYKNIRDFCNNVHVDVVSLNNVELQDIGSILKIPSL